MLNRRLLLPVSLARRSVVIMTPQERERRRLEAMLEELRITTRSELPPLQFLFRMLGRPCFPRGELVTVTGKAKSGKTFFLSLLMAACCAEEVMGIRRVETGKLLKCLWFDTEQSRQSTQGILKGRAAQLCGGADCKSSYSQPPDCKSVGAPAERFPEEMYDVFNSRSMGWEERLMQAAQDVDCCIVCAIHQNKGTEDRNPRGWIGTELNNKSFEVYACELLKPQMVFAVEQTLSRMWRMDGLLYFVVDDEGMPHPSEAPVAETHVTASGGSGKKGYPPMNGKYISWQDGQMQVLLRELFYDVLKSSGMLYYSELQKQVTDLLNCKDTGFWNKLFTEAKNMGIIVNGHNRQGKSVWMLAERQTATSSDIFAENPEAPPY